MKADLSFTVEELEEIHHGMKLRMDELARATLLAHPGYDVMDKGVWREGVQEEAEERGMRCQHIDHMVQQASARLRRP